MDAPSPAPNAAATRPVLARTLAAIVVGLCVGALAAVPQMAGVFLVGLQSWFAGALVGVLLVGATTLLNLGWPRWPTAMLASLAAVVAQHICLYNIALMNRRQAAAQEPAVELFRPGWTNQSFLSYMADEANLQTVLLWTLDACLLAAAAMVIVELSGPPRSAGDI